MTIKTYVSLVNRKEKENIRFSNRFCFNRSIGLCVCFYHFYNNIIRLKRFQNPKCLTMYLCEQYIKVICSRDMWNCKRLAYMKQQFIAKVISIQLPISVLQILHAEEINFVWYVASSLYTSSHALHGYCLSSDVELSKS